MTNDPLTDEWLRASRASRSDLNRCPDCDHKIVDHSAHVGDGGRICAWCPCDRYGIFD